MRRPSRVLRFASIEAGVSIASWGYHST